GGDVRQRRGALDLRRRLQAGAVMTKRIIFLIFGLLLLAGGYYAYRDFWQADAQPRQGAPGRPGGPGAGPIPVVAAAASKGEVAVIMNGLGTATPLRTVTVRSRADGAVLRVFFG